MIYLASILTTLSFVMAASTVVFALVEKNRYRDLLSLIRSAQAQALSKVVAANEAVVYKAVGPVDPAEVSAMLDRVKIMVTHVVETNPVTEKLRADGRQVVRSVEEFSNDLKAIAK